MNTLHSPDKISGNLYFLRPRDAFIDIRLRIAESVSQDFGISPDMLIEFDNAIYDLERDVYLGMLGSHAVGVLKLSEKNKLQYNEVFYGIMTSNHTSIRIIRKILIKTGIAYPLWYGDWDVDRSNETYGKMTGTRPPTELVQGVEKYIGDMVGNPKNGFISLNLGAGNGQSMHEQRKSYIDRKKGSPDPVPKWHFIGSADKIYFPLSRLLQNFWKGDQEVGEEVSRFFMTQIQYAIQSFRKSHPHDLHELQKNLSKLRDFLETETSIFRGKIKNHHYRTDDEYADASKKVRLSPSAEKLISQYLKDPSGFLSAFFGEDFRGDTILERAPIFMQNVFIGDFSGIDQKFPGQSLFHFVSSVRGTSHIDNEPYKNLVNTISKKLAPGGIFIDDGIRRSYTREIRLKEARNALKHIGPSICAYFVKDGAGQILSIIFEKGVGPDEYGQYVFRSETNYQQEILVEGNTIQRINENDFYKHSVEALPLRSRIRDLVMRKILQKIRKEKMPAYYNTLQNLHNVQGAIDKTLQNGESFSVIKNAANAALAHTIKTLH